MKDLILHPFKIAPKMVTFLWLSERVYGKLILNL